MWQQQHFEENAGFVQTSSWQGALSYCENLTHAGYSDWRLPNRNELASLWNLDKTSKPCSDFPNIHVVSPSGYYESFWSSSSIDIYQWDAWTMNFYDGYSDYEDKTSVIRNVICVRSE